MPLTLITGPANSGKARALLDGVRAEAARGREPLLVLPTGPDVEHYRRELAESGLVLGVRVERFAGLMSEVAARGGVVGRPLSPLARERVAAAVAARAPLKALGAASATPGFARALSSLAAELAGARVSPARLRGALNAWAGADGVPARGAYVEDVAALYEAYHRALRRMGASDPDQHAARALDVLRRAPARWRGTPVLFYGFDDLTALQFDAIETLARVVDAPVTVSLAYEAGRLAFSGRASSFQTLTPLASEHRALPARAEHYAAVSRPALHHLERSLFEPDAAPRPAGGALRLLEGGGERAELELVAGEIHALLAAGVAPAEVAVVLRSPSASAALLSEIFDAYEIPHSLEHRQPFSHTAVGRGLLALLRCALLDGDAADLLAWLRTPGVLDQVELADELEAQTRLQGAADAAAARALWERRRWTLETLDRLREAQERGPAALIARTAEELDRLFAAPWRRRAPRLQGSEIDEARALAAGRRALDELQTLGRLAPELACDAAALVSALEGLELIGGRPVGIDAVAVVDPLALRARRVRALFLCGLQEGSFPAPGTSEPFLADEERRRLAESTGLRLPRREDALGTERYLLYATVSRPEELLVLSWHTADDDGTPAAPSLFLEDICDLFTGPLRSERRRRALGQVGWPGPGAPTADARRRQVLLDGPRLAPAPLLPLTDDTVLRDLREVSVWSASGLETWTGCPVRWFVERRLRASRLEPDPEPMTRGGVAHAVLESTLMALREQSGSARLTPDRLPLARRIMHAALAEHLDRRSLSIAPERRPGARRRLEADLERYLAHAASSGSLLEPTHFELAFGFADGEHPALDLGDGVRVRGRVDRVDVGRAGEAVVYDYKGKSAPEPSHWVEGGHYQIALYMRAVEQLLGLRAVGGFYQPLGRSDLRARGLLDADSGVALQCVNGDSRSHDDVQSLLTDTLAGARRAGTEARAGALEPRPATCAFTGGCAHPTICRCET